MTTMQHHIDAATGHARQAFNRLDRSQQADPETVEQYVRVALEVQSGPRGWPQTAIIAALGEVVTESWALHDRQAAIDYADELYASWPLTTRTNPGRAVKVIRDTMATTGHTDDQIDAAVAHIEYLAETQQETWLDRQREAAEDQERDRIEYWREMQELRAERATYGWTDQ